MLSPGSPFSIEWQGRGLGSGLLKDAMLPHLQAADIAGIVRCASTPRTNPPGDSTNISASSRPRPTRFISFF